MKIRTKKYIQELTVPAVTIAIATSSFMMGVSWCRSHSPLSCPSGQILAESNHQNITLSGHKRWVYTVEIAPDGKTLASGSYDGTIKIWDLESDKLLHSISGHADAIESIAISPDGKTLVSGSWDNTIKLWDLGTGTLKNTIYGHADDIKAIAIGPDGQTIASGSYSGTIGLWNLETGQEIGRFRHGLAVTSVAFSPDGKTIASASQDRTIKLWETETGELICTLDGHSKAVFDIAFSPDGQMLASGSYDRNINLWHIETQELLESFQDHTLAVWSVAFSPDGQTLVSGSADKTIKLWSMSAVESQIRANNIRETLSSEDATIETEITDPVQLKDLKQKLFDQIDRNWREYPTWDDNLLYLVRVNQDGAIVSYAPINQAARNYTEKTPLPNLVDSVNSEAGELPQKSFAIFRVVLTPTGVLEVNPWWGWMQ